MAILKRDTCIDSFTGRYYYCNSTWNNWGRWVFAVLILVGFLFLFCLFSCISARRRRKIGQQPYYGTGWTNRMGYNNQPAQNPQTTYYAYQQPAPPYEMNAPPYNQAVHADQLNGVERPAHTYGGGYDPPAGPPPAKK